jgi:hypothetical protein
MAVPLLSLRRPMLACNYEWEQKMASINGNGRYAESVLQCSNLTKEALNATLYTVASPSAHCYSSILLSINADVFPEC